MFALLVTPPQALYTHINLSNGNAASYPGPGCVFAVLLPYLLLAFRRFRGLAPLPSFSMCSFFTTTPSHLQLGDVTYDGQDSECR